jgi:hypothetical protein
VTAAEAEAEAEAEYVAKAAAAGDVASAAVPTASNAGGVASVASVAIPSDSTDLGAASSAIPSARNTGGVESVASVASAAIPNASTTGGVASAASPNASTAGGVVMAGSPSASTDHGAASSAISSVRTTGSQKLLAPRKIARLEEEQRVLVSSREEIDYKQVTPTKYLASKERWDIFEVGKEKRKEPRKTLLSYEMVDVLDLPCVPHVAGVDVEEMTKMTNGEIAYLRHLGVDIERERQNRRSSARESILVGLGVRDRPISGVGIGTDGRSKFRDGVEITGAVVMNVEDLSEELSEDFFPSGKNVNAYIGGSGDKLPLTIHRHLVASEEGFDATTSDRNDRKGGGSVQYVYDVMVGESFLGNHRMGALKMLNWERIESDAMRKERKEILSIASKMSKEKRDGAVGDYFVKRQKARCGVAAAAGTY